jgi:hypothetical protein
MAPSDPQKRENSQLPAVTIYEAMPHAVWIVAKSVGFLLWNHNPTARLSSTGPRTTIEIRKGDHPRTISRDNCPENPPSFG